MVITIAVAGPITGQLATIGDQFKIGAQAAADAINAAGGVGGRQIKLSIQDDQCDAFLSLWHEAHPDDQRPLAPVAALMQLVGTGASGKAHAILGCSDPDDALLPWLDQVLTLARTPQDVQDAVRRIDPDTDLCWAEWDQILGKERDLPPTETALATYARTEVAFQEMSQTLDRGIDM